MAEGVESILSGSNNIISKLQLLAVFFEDETIYKIYIRSQVIHKLFISNPELDINKLELFHLQYTQSIIELLRKIKKTNEKNVNILLDEIHLNEELVGKINSTLQVEKSYDANTKIQAAKINQSLNKLYENLSGYSKLNPIAKSISEFSNSFAKDFFIPVSDSFIYELMDNPPDNVYKNGYATIEKKLLGLQCKHGFSNVFYCGFRSENLVVEVYKLVNVDEYFVFYPAGNVFIEFPFSKIADIVVPETLTKKEKLIRELTVKNDSLTTGRNAVKTNLPTEVKNLLTEYLDKISALDFIDFIDDYDVQANILKAMLNTDRM